MSTGKIISSLGILITLLSLSFSSLKDNIQFSQVVIDYQFNQKVIFEAEVSPISLIKDVEQVVLQIFPPKGDAIVETVSIDDQGKIHHVYDISQKPWYPFITVEFSFRITLSNGQDILSDMYSFKYEDNRFNWSTISNESFEVHWNTNDYQLGQMILNTANSGLQTSKTYLPANPGKTINIYAYEDPADLKSALSLENNSWVTGHAEPDLHIIMVSAPNGPGLQLELERQIPHEIAHILIYETSKAEYVNLPIWLTEGIATISEIYPNLDYQRILSSAAETGSLLPMVSLCASFPPEAPDVILAYAQAGSFSNFLFKKYGASGLENLINLYHDGVSCEDGLLNATGNSLSQLEALWRQQVLGINPEMLILKNLSPYLVLMGLIVLLPVLPVLFLKIK